MATNVQMNTKIKPENEETDNILIKTVAGHVDANIPKHEYKTIMKEEKWDFGGEVQDEFGSKHLLFHTEVEKIQQEEQQEEARKFEKRNHRIKIIYFFITIFILVGPAIIINIIIAIVNRSSSHHQQSFTLNEAVNGTLNFTATTHIQNLTYLQIIQE